MVLKVKRSNVQAKEIQTESTAPEVPEKPSQKCLTQSLPKKHVLLHLENKSVGQSISTAP